MRSRGLEGLFPIPEEAARIYEEKRDALVADVDRALLVRSDLSSMIGHAPIDLVTDNHRNHARFMSTVFQMNLPGLIHRIVPWVYRAYRMHGFSFSYFPVELAAWAEAACVRMGADAEPIANVYQWMLDQHDEMIERSKTPAAELCATPSNDPEVSELLDLLVAGMSKEVGAMIAGKARQVSDLENVYLRLVQPAMYRLGSLWECGKVSVAQEHLATAIMGRVMAAVYQRFEVAGGYKGRAIVAAVTDEHHELGPRIVADLLEMDGWNVTFLGANMPTRDLVEIARELRPSIVGLSATMPYHLPRVRYTIRCLRAQRETEQAKVIVGGLAFCLAPEAGEAVCADGVALDGREAVELVSERRVGEDAL